MFNAVILTEVNEIHLVSTLFVQKKTIFLPIGPRLVFDHWKFVNFNNLLLELYWNSNISGTELYRALKMKKPKEKFVKTQYLKWHLDIFKNSWVTGMHTLENILEKCCFPVFECHHWHIIYIYIYAFSRRFYPKRLTVHSGYTYFCQYMCSLGIKPTTFALLTQCSNHWPTEKSIYFTNSVLISV